MLNINVKLAAIAVISLTAFSTLSFAQPPEAALKACEDKSDGDSCSFSDDRMGDVTGLCYSPREDTFVCATEEMISARRAQQDGQAEPDGSYP